MGRSSTTLCRWHSGYHGFKPKLTNKLGLSCSQNCSQSPAVCSRTGDPATRCEYILVSSTSPSLARKVTVPPVPGEIGVCLQVYKQYQAALLWKNCTNPPSEPPLALLQIGVAETGMSRLEGRARMRVLSVANLLHKPAGISATSGVAGGLERGRVDTAPFSRVWGEAPRL